MQDTIKDLELTAHEIAVDVLERTRQALFTDDVALFLSFVALPYTIETLQGRHIVNSRSQVEDVFWRSVSFYKDTGVVDLVRVPVAVTVLPSGTIGSTYETTLLKAGEVADRARYLAYMELVQFGPRWRFKTSQYAIGDSVTHNQALLGRGTFPKAVRA